MRPSAKERVRAIYPNARAERHRTMGRKVYYLIRDGRAFMPMADGKTEREAWQKAWSRIEDKRAKSPKSEETT